MSFPLIPINDKISKNERLTMLMQPYFKCSQIFAQEFVKVESLPQVVTERLLAQFQSGDFDKHATSETEKKRFTSETIKHLILWETNKILENNVRLLDKGIENADKCQAALESGNLSDTEKDSEMTSKDVSSSIHYSSYGNETDRGTDYLTSSSYFYETSYSDYWIDVDSGAEGDAPHKTTKNKGKGKKKLSVSKDIQAKKTDISNSIESAELKQGKSSIKRKSGKQVWKC